MNIRSKIFGGGKAAEESPVIQAKAPKGVKADSLDSIPVVREETRRANTREGDRHRLPDEQIRLTHEARDRRVFADGALTAARFLATQHAPGVYTMRDVIGGVSGGHAR